MIKKVKKSFFFGAVIFSILMMIVFSQTSFASDQGSYIPDGRQIKITKKNMTIWHNFNWQKKDSTSKFYDQTLFAKGRYYHSNGETYYSIFDSKNNWPGYVNSIATDSYISDKTAVPKKVSIDTISPIDTTITGTASPNTTISATVWRQGKQVSLGTPVTSDSKGKFSIAIHVQPKGNESIAVYSKNEYTKQHSKTTTVTAHYQASFGDSITVGRKDTKSFINTFRDSYASWPVDNYGVNGSTIASNRPGDLGNRIDAVGEQLALYDIVSLSIGTNDYGGLSHHSLKDIELDLQQSIDKIKQANPDVRIIGILPLTRYQSVNSSQRCDDLPGVNGYTFNELREVLKKVYRTNNVHIISFENESVHFLPSDYYDFTLHPNQAKQDELADIFHQKINKVIK